MFPLGSVSLSLLDFPPHSISRSEPFSPSPKIWPVTECLWLDACMRSESVQTGMDVIIGFL